MALICGFGVLLFFRLFGLPGLYIYIATAIISSNIQVLKAVKFNYLPEPIAVGTITFTSTYLCTNIIAEHYGKAQAKTGVWLSFFSLFLMMIFMVLTLGWPPLDSSMAESNTLLFNGAHQAMAHLFMPLPAIFVASLIAYIVSQYNDIWIYQAIHRLTGEKWLWLRANLATMVSALVDNTVFSLLAWIIFAPQPLELHTVIYTYILGSYVLRLLLSTLDTFFMYLARHFKPQEPV